MSDIRPALDRIDQTLAAAGQVTRDRATSADAMRWQPDEPPHQDTAQQGETDDLREVFGDPIHVYTRADMFRDGFLVDVSRTAAEAGFLWPVALTRAVWEDCVAWTDEDNDRQRTCQDEAGRLWDVLVVAAAAARRGSGGRAVTYPVYRVPRGGRARLPRPVELVLRSGPGDDGEPVMTITAADEDWS